LPWLRALMLESKDECAIGGLHDNEMGSILSRADAIWQLQTVASASKRCTFIIVSARRCGDRARVCWLVRSFVTPVVISFEKYNSGFHEIWHICSAYCICAKFLY